MRTGNYTIAASALAMGLATLPSPAVKAQPLFDRVDVNIPYTVTIGDKTLEPGNYVIQQERSFGGGGQVLLIYGDNGMKFETSALAIPALENRTQEDTRVTLHHIGNNYYFDKVWIQGKDYGYEFPLPDNVKRRMNEAAQPVSVAANYTAAPTATTENTTPPRAKREQATPTTPPPTTPPPVTEQHTSPPPAEQQPQTAPPATTPPATPENTADREMPHTSAGWLSMLLSGGALSGMGLALRRKR
jgi:hypothetical protein